MNRNIDVIILSGGRGSRLLKISKDVPKPLVNISYNRCALDFIIRHLSKNKIRKIFLSICKKQELFENYIKSRNYKNVFISKEKNYLGTGGAIKNTLKKNKVSNQFFVVNGDTISPASEKIVLFKKKSKGQNVLGISKKNNSKRYGAISVKKNNFFFESKNNSKSLVNNGNYLFYKKDFFNFKKKVFSLENDFLPYLMSKKRLKIINMEKTKFTDIGIPSSFKNFSRKLDQKKLNILLFCRKNDILSQKIKNIIDKKNVNLTVVYSVKRFEKLPKRVLKKNYDFIFSYRSYQILKPLLLSKSFFAVNFHPSPPEYRGSGGVNFAIKNGKKKFGVTTHFINNEIDNGKILLVKNFRINKQDNLSSLLQKTHKQLYLLARSFLTKLFNNKIDLIELSVKNKFKWSKKINYLGNLNDLYEIPKNIKKTKLNKLIKSTYLGKKYRPFVDLYGKKFFYEPN